MARCDETRQLGLFGERPSTVEEPSPSPVERLRRRLAPYVARPIADLVLTRNRSRIVSARPAAGATRSRSQGAGERSPLAVRIHRCFVDAPDEVLAAVGLVLDDDPSRRRLGLPRIREHFRVHGAEDAARRPRTLRSKGRHHDLEALRDRVNERYFDDAVQVAITWGRDAPSRGGRRRRRGLSIRLGSYAEAERLVRIHPVLDRADVPRYVVESIVHHEMLHAVIPAEPGRIRRRIHTPEFRRREREFRHHERAERWIAKNLERLARLR